MKNLLLSFLLIVSVADAGTIKIHVMYKEAGNTTNLEGAEVQCWDEDLLFDSDDVMTGIVNTDSSGKAELEYTKKRWDSYPLNRNPDIYCVVRKKGVIFPLRTKTMKDHDQDQIADFRTVFTYPDRVRRGDPGTINGCGPASFPKSVREDIPKLTGMLEACNNHDLCYENCQETQLSCDKELKAIGQSVCHAKQDLPTFNEVCIENVNVIFDQLQKSGAMLFKKARGKC